MECAMVFYVVVYAVKQLTNRPKYLFKMEFSFGNRTCNFWFLQIAQMLAILDQAPLCYGMNIGDPTA